MTSIINRIDKPAARATFLTVKACPGLGIPRKLELASEPAGAACFTADAVTGVVTTAVVALDPAAVVVAPDAVVSLTTVVDSPVIAAARLVVVAGGAAGAGVA